MYKVFVNNSVIILSDKKENLNDYFILENLNDILEILNDLYLEKLKGVGIFCKDLETDWENFKTLFKLEISAGGKVHNKENKILFIKHFNKWDLPKGHIEPNETIEETAIREVTEETGVAPLEIVKRLPITYYIFKREKYYLKTVHWFEMKTDFEGATVPQKEESISIATFKNKAEIKEVLVNAFESLKCLFE